MTSKSSSSIHSAPSTSKKSFWNKLRLTLQMIKFQHSIFALPFALASLFIATDGHPSLKTFFFIVCAMVTARNAAMSFNRLVDKNIDAANPRTQNRELPSGALSTKFATSFCVINSILFVIIAAQFNELTLLLSPLALLILLGYSLTKRVTSFTQISLGLALGSAPIAAWIAVTGAISSFSLALGAGVLFWVAGFDLIYSTMDYSFDKQNGMKNLVVKLGIAKALYLARLFHVFCFGFLILAGTLAELSHFYYLGCLTMGGILSYEHRLVKPNDLSKVNMAFFSLNGYAALAFFGFVLLDVYLR